MQTRVIRINADRDCSSAIREAAACLSAGGLVVFPTETVYGLGAVATNPDALHRLREVKQRSEQKPFTVHIGSRSAVHRFVPGLAGVGSRLTEKAWPGPLTLIFQITDPAASQVIAESSPDHIPAMYHDGTIGIRCPDDTVAAGLLSMVPGPVVAASANPAAAPAPVSGEEAIEALDGQVDLILDAGRSRYAKASTIVRVDGDRLEIVREGVLDERTVRRLSRVNFLLVCSGNTCRSPMAEGILRHLLAARLGCKDDELEERGYYVESAGVSTYGGAPPSDAGVRVLRGRGIDISDHRSQPVTLEMAQRADYIFGMTASHCGALASLGPSVRQRCRPLDDDDIEDPIGENDGVYAECADRIEKALRRRLEEIVL